MSIVKFDNVTRVYTSGEHELKALDKVSFTLDEGKFVVILGPSGAGKSTLLNMLGGLDSPTSGTITVNGRDISTLSDNELADYRAATVGFVFQFYNLIPTLTVYENVQLVSQISPDALDAKKMIGEVGLSDHLHNFPSELSGGEQQRVSIARALAKNKKTDEIPSSDLIAGKQDKAQLMDTFNSFVQIMDSMVIILVVAAAVLGIVVLYNLGIMSYVERSRELATLKVLGFRNRAIGRLLISQNIWLTFIGVIIGLPAGVGVLQWLLTALAGEYEMKLMLGPLTYCVSILLTFGVSLLVGLMVARKNKKIDMVEHIFRAASSNGSRLPARY